MRPERDFSESVCQPFLWRGGNHGVLVIHGFTGSVAQMRPLAEGLHAAGFTVMGVNLPGHATTMDDMLTVNWQNWLDSAKDAFLELSKTCTRVSVTGLSMGGCLTLAIAETLHPTAIAPIAAPMGTKGPLWLAGIASPFMSHVMWKPRTDNALDDRYDYGYPGFPTRSGVDLNRIIKLTRRNLHAVTCPTLIVQSRDDETISANSADVILSGISSQRKGVLWLDGMPHVVTLSQEGPRVTQAIIDHFRQAEQA